jgi:argininosuccinate lyase
VTLWAGRVGGELAPEVADFLAAEDAELLPYDCMATAVHAARLHAAGLLDDDELGEAEQVLATLEYALGEEDVHTLIERSLGEVGRKLQAGRSRNDQVAAALRLYVADAAAEAIDGVEELARTLLDRAEEEADTALPGYTHLQRAQPVTLGHHLLAWVEMLDRDRSRFGFARDAALPSPLGSAALAGSTLDLPPPPGPTAANSLDAVADRDFALDYLYACAMLFGHLSRIGEEVTLWVSSEFGFARLPDEAATGSSLMPQKLNPDVAELVRGKAGTALGRLTGLLAVVKGLPLAYNRDLQEDKTPVFAARRDTCGALAALRILLAGLDFDRERMAAASADPLLRATDAAEELVRAGVPFRDAHERVAGAVRDGTFGPPTNEPSRAAPGPAGIADALAAARARFRTQVTRTSA